jgi:hypothetical protein
MLTKDISTVLAGTGPSARVDRRSTSTPQVIALRFAPGGEFVAVAQKAADEGWEPGDIKMSIIVCRANKLVV